MRPVSLATLDHWPVLLAFQGAKGALTVIDGGHWLGVLLIQGAILGWWGVA
jgi:hypothetical protein